MTGPVQSTSRTEIERLDFEKVASWLESQRWYASKSRHISSLHLEESVRHQYLTLGSSTA